MLSQVARECRLHYGVVQNIDELGLLQCSTAILGYLCAVLCRLGGQRRKNQRKRVELQDLDPSFIIAVLARSGNYPRFRIRLLKKPPDAFKLLTNNPLPLQHATTLFLCIIFFCATPGPGAVAVASAAPSTVPTGAGRVTMLEQTDRLNKVARLSACNS